MNLKLRKISKLNIFVAVFMCVLLLFCFCSTSYVQASDTKSGSNSFDDKFYKYIPFANYICKSGYMYYNSSALDGITEAQCDFSNIDLSKLENGDSFKKFIAKYYPDYKDFQSTFDLYVIEGLSYGYTSFFVDVLVVVEKGSKVVFLNDIYPSWSGYNASIMTDSKHMFGDYRFFNNSSFNSSIFDGDGRNHGQTGLSVNWNYWDSGTDPSVMYFTPYVDVGKASSLIFTNCAVVDSKKSAQKYFNGDTSVATNQDDTFVDTPTKEYPAESFYWDSMTCKPSVVGVDVDSNKNKYCFAFNYTYSCPLMVDPAEMFSCEVVYSSDIRYQDGKGRMYSLTDTQKDSFSLNKHKNGYTNDSLCLQGNIGEMGFGDAMNLLVSSMLSFLPNMGAGTDEVSKYNQYTVKSAKIYVTVFLYHIPDPDTLFSNSDIMQSAKNNTILSTDVRSFSFDLLNLHEDTEGTQVKPTVTTEDVTDDSGNVTDKKVTDVVATDDTGKTVVNITIDNSNKVIDGNANVNTGGGSGSGDGDDEDKNTKSFWKYVSGIVALFTALLNSDSGLFAVIASYFKFIPKDFWSVTIGAIVVIAVLSIYRLAKKGG